MEEVLSGYVRKLVRSLAICTLVMVIALLSAGEGRVIGALFAGYLAAAVCIWTLVYRTWRSASLDMASAKKQMLWGLCLRLVTCFTVLAVAAQISTRVFAVTALGLLLCYGLAMGHLVYYNIQSGKK